MGRPAEQLLEFDQLRQIVAGFTTSPPGRRVIEALPFQRDAASLDREFALIREAVAYLRSGSEAGFGSLADPESWLKKLAIPTSVLSSAELIEALSLLDATAGIRQIFHPIADKFPLLAERSRSLADFRRLAAAIRTAILPNGEISDNASSELKRIRGSVAQTRDRIQRSLEQILRTRGNEAGQDYVTLRNDRFVIPVRASDRRSVAGVVHGASATGQTVFVEPLDTIEFNNRLVQLSEDEAAEIARILAELTEQLRAERGALVFAASAIAHLDSVLGRGRYAREFNCVMPEFNAANLLILEDARNPVLEKTLRERGRQVVPMSLSLGSSSQENAGGTVMVISGPNTGGKTVALKTVGLASLAAQSAIPVPANRAALPVFDQVLADIGDEQSITADLSTFSAHVLNLKTMLETATGHSLVLVDEMGTGTAPEEGAALAIALLEEFRKLGALTIATTHHDRLKTYASTTPGIVNAAVEFDEVNLRPTYRLLVGLPGVSSGLQIARRLGLSEEIVARARSEMPPEALESRDLIAYLHRTREEIDMLQRRAREELGLAEAERRSLQTDWTERQKKRIQQLEKSFAETQKRLESEVANLAADISDRKLRAQMEKSSSRRLSRIEAGAREETDAAVLETLAASQQDLGIAQESPAQPPAPEELSPGIKVRVRGMKQPVIFRRHDGRNAEVEAGPMRMKIPVADILSIERNIEMGTNATGKGRGITVSARPADEPSIDEVNVIGQTVEEATQRLDKVLDAAALAGKSQIRVIHGHGTGALRRGIGEFLSAHPLVVNFHSEAEDRGGTAITIIELQ